MSYVIQANVFHPMISIDGCFGRLHAICYNKCNFHCNFCELPLSPSFFKCYDYDSFSDIVDTLLPRGNGFKFTGGEPTLNKDIKTHMEIVKNKRGHIYLDTNGSNPKVVQNLLESNMIDVLGVSLKGITPEHAENTARVKKTICWDHVLRTISNGVEAQIPTIITVVVN